MSAEKKHVLVVSGEPRALAEIKMGLMDYFDVSIASASAAALSALERYEMAAVVINIGERRDAAFSALGGIIEFIREKHIPVLFLAESDSADDEAAAFAAGASDYATRRNGSAKAIVDRINLRIRAGENEKRLSGEKSASSAHAAAPKTVLAGKTILIAEDVELNREIVANMLSDVKGLVLEFACNGREAVEKFAKTPGLYSLILMDVHMPEVSGLEATKAIRSLNCENARDIPIIALSGSSEKNEKIQCLEAGMNSFLEKPMEYDKLISAVAEYCM